MNNQSLDAIAENWYARLNNLKARYHSDDLTLEKKQQCERLISIMIVRMTKITPLYIEARMKAFSRPNSFLPGGVILK